MAVSTLDEKIAFLENKKKELNDEREEKERKLPELEKERDELETALNGELEDEERSQKAEALETRKAEINVLTEDIDKLKNDIAAVQEELDSNYVAKKEEEKEKEEAGGKTTGTDGDGNAETLPPPAREESTSGKPEERNALFETWIAKWQSWKTKWMEEIQALKVTLDQKLSGLIVDLHLFYEKGYISDSDVEMQRLEYKRDHIEDWFKLLVGKIEEVLNFELGQIEALKKMPDGADFTSKSEQWKAIEIKLEGFANKEGETFAKFWVDWNAAYGRQVGEDSLKLQGTPGKSPKQPKEKPQEGDKGDKPDFPLSDSSVLVRLKEAEKQAAVAAAAVEALKKELAELAKKDAMTPEDIKTMEEKQKELMKRMNEFEEITKLITDLVGLVEVASSQILPQPQSGLGMIHPEDALPKVIVCGTADYDQVPKIIVCEAKIREGKRPEFPSLNGKKEDGKGGGQTGGEQGVGSPGTGYPGGHGGGYPGGGYPGGRGGGYPGVGYPGGRGGGYPGGQGGGYPGSQAGGYPGSQAGGYPGTGGLSGFGGPGGQGWFPGQEGGWGFGAGGQGSNFPGGELWWQMYGLCPPMPICPPTKKSKCKKKSGKTENKGKCVAGGEKSEDKCNNVGQTNWCDRFSEKKPKKKPKKCFCQIYNYCPY